MLSNVLSNWVFLVLLGVLSFFLTPFMIHRLGGFQYGVYMLAFSVVGYSELLEAGIRNTLQRFVACLSGTGDRQSLNSVFSTALALTVGMGGVVVGLSLALSRVLPPFFKVQSMQEGMFAWLMIALGLNMGVALPASLLRAYLTGLQRFDLQNLLETALQGLRALLIVTVLLRGHGVLAVGWCVLASTLVCVPITCWVIRKVDPETRFSSRLVSLRAARQLLGFSFWTLLNNAGQFLRDSTDSMVIGRVLNPALITPFSVASRLVAYFRPIIIGMVSPLLPRLSELDGKGRRREIRLLFLRMTRFSALASLAIGSMLVLHGRTLLLLWVGKEYVSSYPVLVLLTVGGVASLAQFGTLHTLIALGRHRAYGLWTLGEGVANLVLSIIWARKYGIVGVALGTAVPLLAVKLSLQPWYVTRVLEMRLSEYVKKALARPVVACAVFVGLCGSLGGFQASGSLWHFLWTAGSETLFLAALAFALGLEGSDRKLLLARFARFARFVPALGSGSEVA